MQSRVSTIVGTAVVAFLFAFTSMAVTQAQTAPPPPGDGRPPVTAGDIIWAFAQEDPLFDERVATALGTLMWPKIEATAPDGARIVRVEQQEPGIFPSGFVAPAADVPLLLAAAGFGQTPPFVELGRCKVWVGAPQDGIESAITPAEAAPLLTAALQESLASLGVQSQLCASTLDPADAHLLVWVAYGDAPELVVRSQPTFLTGTGAPPVSSTPPPGQSVPSGAPQPGVTGNAGFADSTNGWAPVAIAVLSVICVALVLGARLVTRRV